MPNTNSETQAVPQALNAAELDALTGGGQAVPPIIIPMTKPQPQPIPIPYPNVATLT